MQWRGILLSCCVLFAGAAHARAQVAVIAHPAVPEDSISKSQLLDFYTGDITEWKNGDPVIVLDLQVKSAIKMAFYEFIGKSTSRMKSIWLKKKLSGEGGPPEAFPSEEQVLQKVASTPGAIGFVDLSKVDTHVKTLLIIADQQSVYRPRDSFSDLAWRSAGAVEYSLFPH